MAVTAVRRKALVGPRAAGASSLKDSLRPRLGKETKSSVKTLPKRNRARAPEDFKTSTLQIRLKNDVKEKAIVTLDRLGISLPEAVRVFLGRIVSEQAFPFSLEVPNVETAAALRESIASTANRKRYTSAEDMIDDLEEGVGH